VDLAGVRSRDHRPSFGQLLGGSRYARTASMQADTNKNRPQRNAELKGRHFIVTIKRHTRVFAKAMKRLFHELQRQVIPKRN
jgi:hypothetical protein